LKGAASAAPKDTSRIWASAPDGLQVLAAAQLAPEDPIRTYNLCFLGFGNVNRTLAQLLRDREQELREHHGISFRITGISTQAGGERRAG